MLIDLLISYLGFCRQLFPDTIPVPSHSCHFPSQVALARADTSIEAITEPLSFYQNVSPSKELRDASNEAESIVRDYGVESSMRLDVFKAKTAAQKNLKESGQWDKLTAEEQRLVEKMVCLFFVWNFREYINIICGW